MKQKSAAGWRLVAAEWEREVETEEDESRELKEEVPFGLKVADDCLYLEEDPTEKQVGLIEVGPRILSSEGWITRRQRLFSAAQGSTEN